MRLTVEVLQRVDSCYNPCGERQANLRSMKIPSIENLGALKDGFDAIDMTDNSIRILGGFPCFTRLKTLLISRNKISHITPNISTQLPHLETLVMAQNQIETFSELDSLAGLPLVRLVLTDNKVTSLENYRLYMIHLFPLLKMLDFTKVNQAEREASDKMFGPSKPVSAPSSSKPTRKSQETKTESISDGSFIPGELPTSTPSSKKSS